MYNVSSAGSSSSEEIMSDRRSSVKRKPEAALRSNTLAGTSSRSVAVVEAATQGDTSSSSSSKRQRAARLSSSEVYGASPSPLATAPLPPLTITDMPDDMLYTIAERVCPEPDVKSRLASPLMYTNKAFRSVAQELVRQSSAVTFSSIEELESFPDKSYPKISTVKLDSNVLRRVKNPEKYLKALKTKFPNITSLDVSGVRNLNIASARVISQMSQLTDLNLSNCNLNDQFISIALHNKPKLRKLDVSKNSKIGLSAAHQISQMSELTELNLSNCDCSDQHVAAAITNKSKLNKLDISDNISVDGSTASKVSGLSQLTDLNLSACDLEDTHMSSALNNKPILKKLDISVNQYVGVQTARTIGQMSKLTSLDISVYGLPNNLISIALSNKGQLKELIINNCNIDITVARTINNIRGLEKIAARYALLNPDNILPIMLHGLDCLESVDIAGSGLDLSIGPEDDDYNAEQAQLNAQESVGFDSINAILQLPKIKELCIEKCVMESFGIRALHDLCFKLESLNYSHTCLDENDFVVISNMVNLKKLSISYDVNEEEEGKEQFKEILPKLVKLEELDIGDASFDESILQAIRNLPKIKILRGSYYDGRL